MLGGHGFIREWGLDQEYRDTRITAIYEATNTIQVGRKILPSGGQVLGPYLEEIDAFVQHIPVVPQIILSSP